MIIKLKNRLEEYIVHGIKCDNYNQKSYFGIYNQEEDSAFMEEINNVDIIDSRIPQDWVFSTSNEYKGIWTLYPKEFVEPIDIEGMIRATSNHPDAFNDDTWKEFFTQESTDFWERYHDGCEIAEEIFAKVTKKLKQFHEIKD